MLTESQYNRMICVSMEYFKNVRPNVDVDDTGLLKTNNGINRKRMEKNIRLSTKRLKSFEYMHYAALCIWPVNLCAATEAFHHSNR